ncbi:hypothetical protein LJR219_000996 [Phenylobacterium sp. LjRoot219]|uniref:hypothetical protein n=1 Tax=Phenylobacterium sp. LjRoot219 TaxID=3342283 RepID=UPI003ECD4A42
MLSLIAAVMLATASPETPSTEAGPPATPAKAEAAEEPPSAAGKKTSRDDVVCWDQTPLGTRFSKRVCASRGDLDDRRQRDQDLIRGVRTAPTPGDVPQ